MQWQTEEETWVTVIESCSESERNDRASETRHMVETVAADMSLETLASVMTLHSRRRGLEIASSRSKKHITKNMHNESNMKENKRNIKKHETCLIHCD